MTTTANIGATKIESAQAQKEVTANEAFDVFDAALSELALTLTDANYTLSTATTPQQWQYGVLNLTGTLTAPRNVVAPVNKKLYVVVNGTTGGFPVTLKTSAGTGIAVAAGASAILRCDGTNVVALSAGSGVGSVTSVAASVPGFLNVAGSPITAAGTLAIGYSGTALPVANGGTGGTTASAARTALGVATAAQGTLAELALQPQLTENVGIALDPALSADGTYSGIVQAGTSAAALAFGELCYRVTATGKWALAKADVVGTSVNQIGMCVLAAGAADAATTMLLYGKVRADVLFDAFTVGSQLYISAATAGKTVSTAPTGTTDFVVRVVGQAEDANTIFFNPSTDYITLV